MFIGEKKYPPLHAALQGLKSISAAQLQGWLSVIQSKSPAAIRACSTHLHPYGDISYPSSFQAGE